MKFYGYVILFLILNFGTLTFGSWLMNNGPKTEWYLNLSKAPWTPPGWVFGVAWTSIMICFSVFMAKLLILKKELLVYLLFTIQMILNIGWNYIFFNQHHILLGFVVIAVLTLVIAVFIMRFYSVLKRYTWLIAPYFIWLCIATSLNGYILINN